MFNVVCADFKRLIECHLEIYASCLFAHEKVSKAPDT